MAVFCGVDVGAAATKLVLLDGAGAVVGRAVRPSGVDYARTAEACLAEALAAAGATRAAVRRTVATGYGRRNVAFADADQTEIQCHGVGAYHAVPRRITVVDIGGQDNKVIRLDAAGRRIGFRMNRKCAAGTGAFLEEIALRLDLPVAALDALAHEATAAVELSSFCTVFAKTEILAHLRRGAPLAAIVRGAYAAVVQRVAEMDPLEGEVVLTGGVAAHHPIVAELLAARRGGPVIVPPEPQLTGALGAALGAARHQLAAE
ncbi:MAG TPA: acyl-CoA dehydratase activase [Polyangia bacterium]|jgi:predicted CoA-substrate-specific enzyme activase